MAIDVTICEQMEEEKDSKILLFAHTQEKKQNQTLMPLPEHKVIIKRKGTKVKEKKKNSKGHWKPNLGRHKATDQ